MTAISKHPRPLWRRNSTGETAEAAAKAGDRRPLRQHILDEIEAADGPLIPEEILARLRARGIKTVLTTVRPRCTDLSRRMGLITDSGVRKPGEGGCKAIAWRPTTAAERAAFQLARASEADQ